jgi:hypothetical protein
VRVIVLVMVSKIINGLFWAVAPQKKKAAIVAKIIFIRFNKMSIDRSRITTKAVHKN